MVPLLTVIGRWLYANVVGNEVASLIAVVAAWFWKIGPHLKAQREHREAEKQHRADVLAEFDAVHDRLDEIHPPADPDQGGRHGVDSQTGTFPPVAEEAP